MRKHRNGLACLENGVLKEAIDMPHRIQRDPLLDALSMRIDKVKEQLSQVESEIITQEGIKMTQLSDISDMKSDRNEAKAEVDRLFDCARACAEDSPNIAWEYREDAKRYLERVRELKEELDYAYDELDGIKAYLSELNEKKKALKTALAFLIRQHKEQLARIKMQNAANWDEKPCAVCGRMLKYNITWEHIPSICSECKKKLHPKH